MSSRNAFVVEVTSAPRESREVVAGRVASQLNISPAKAASLVARVPGVITRALPEERALRVVLRLQAAGLAAMHRRASASDAAAPDADPPPAPTLTDDHVVAEGGVRNPTGYDRIPSLDATRVDEIVEIDPKLTPMREAGFGAADVMLPTSPPPRRPTIVDVGGVSGFSDARVPPVDSANDASTADDASADDPSDDHPEAPAPKAEAADDHHGRTTDDADPTMIMPPDAAPPAYARTAPPGDDHVSGTRATPVPVPVAGPAPASRLRDAIARDRNGDDRPRRPTLGDDDLRTTPPPDVAYRSTRSASERPLTLTPPPDAVLKRSGVSDDELPSSLERRRGRFGRRLSALVALPVTLSWLLSAGFLYVLLPEDLRATLWVPLAAATAIAALTGALAAALATARIAGDVVRLRDDTQRIAMGDLTAPVGVRRDDELGDTAASVDRMRVSLQEALDRLRKRR